ncbi:hypothetical protein [Flavobacterium sp. SM2513]|uniref:hypothetical protein n=1 Tax=Flavobacterium sp. SM2513 TaxID=3424766 RepID=UPI003D7F6A7A
MRITNEIYKAIPSKSTTIVQLIHLFMDAYPTYKYRFTSQENEMPSNDFTLVLEIKGTVIAFENHSYSRKESEIRIQSLLNQHNPHLLICACEAAGESVDAIIHITASKSYEILKMPVYYSKNSNPFLHRSKAEQLKEVITKMQLI